MLEKENKRAPQPSFYAGPSLRFASGASAPLNRTATDQSNPAINFDIGGNLSFFSRYVDERADGTVWKERWSK
jgi:hypothetical protein